MLMRRGHQGSAFLYFSQFLNKPLPLYMTIHEQTIGDHTLPHATIQDHRETFIQIIFRWAPPLYEFLWLHYMRRDTYSHFLFMRLDTGTPGHKDIKTLGHQTPGLQDNGWGFGAHLPQLCCDFFPF